MCGAQGPPSARLLGRGGVGKSVLGAALRDRRVTLTAGPADAVLYCFAGGLRDTDRRAIEALGAAPTPLLVVWTKADAAGSWRAADDAARALSAEVQREVVPVMAILDAVDASNLPAVRRIAASGLALDDNVVVAAAALGDDADLLRRLGGYGLACAVGGVRSNAAMTDDELLTRLCELSGVDAVLPPLAEAFAGYQERREDELDAALRHRVRVDCLRRDEAEQLLLDRLLVRR